MDRDPSSLVRPVPHEPIVRRVVRQWAESVGGWCRWMGSGRLIVGVVAAAAAVVVGWWVLASPTPPVEASLPRAETPTSISAPGGEAEQALSSSSGDVAPTTVVSTEVVVHVSGEVARPGIVRLVTGSRVIDAVDAAGGATMAADLGAINLAALLLDGQKVVVPRPGDVVDPLLTGGAPAGSGVPSGPLSLSNATAAQLEELPGVGPVLAAAIVRWRDEHGGFVAVDQLDDVPGIGPALLERLRGEVVP